METMVVFGRTSLSKSVISNRAARNARSPGKPPLPDIQGHFHGHEGGLDPVYAADDSSDGASSDEAPAVLLHPIGPTLPPGIACRIDHPEQSLADGGHAGEAKDASFEPAHPVYSEAPDQGPHAHRDDQSCRAPRQQPREYDIGSFLTADRLN